MELRLKQKALTNLKNRQKGLTEKAFNMPIRKTILYSVAKGYTNKKKLIEILKEEQDEIMQHLTILLRCRLIIEREESQEYSLNDELISIT